MWPPYNPFTLSVANLICFAEKVDKQKFNDLIIKAKKAEKRGELQRALEFYLSAQELKPDHEKLQKKIQKVMVLFFF